MKQGPLSRLLIAAGFGLLPLCAAAGPLDAPDAPTLERARVIVKRMTASDRGPYARIRWYCNDGTVLAPEPYACRAHGGGRQHAQYSEDRATLAGLGYSVGTIIAALPYDEFFDRTGRHARMRELAVERYLTDTADGWVLKRARFYRGRVQVEDEEAAGTALLLRLYNDGNWVRDNFLLARETARSVPHTGGGDLTRDVRRVAQAIAEAEAAFEPLRIEVHTRPNAATANKVRDWIAHRTKQTANPATHESAANLALSLDRLFGTAGREQRLAALRKRLASQPATQELAQRLAPTTAVESTLQSIAKLSGLLAMFREMAGGDTDTATRLALLDAMPDVEAELRILADERLAGSALTRSELAELAEHLVVASYGSGLLSPGERDVLAAELSVLRVNTSVSTNQYLTVTRALDRAIGWAVQSVRYTFAEPLTRYTALEPRAAGFVDDLLRASAVLPLANTTQRLSQDSQRLAGIRRSIDGRPAPGLLALNPGLAIGTLRILDDAALAAGVTPERSEIVVLPQTVSELPPVAGVLTGGEGNLLSHVQLLARNFGIPNVSVAGELPRALLALANKEILLAVDRAGSIVIATVASLEPQLLETLRGGKAVPDADELTRIDVPDPNLTVRQPLPIDALNAGLSGKVVGPKAANLGELNRLFPGRVAPAIALPFGLFEEHMRAGDAPIRARINRVFGELRAERTDQPGFDAELDAIRVAIRATGLNAESRAALVPMMASLFGEPGSYGVFVRSDTNVEDLPGFTGAGLNETVPNVVGLDAQLATIPRVWSSVLSPRAVAWRSRILRQPGKIYASVLLMKSVPADKSGVLVTRDLENQAPGLTVSTAWGVGGAVGGEQAESLVLLPDGGERLIFEAKTPYRRALADGGGVAWLPAPDGPVLTPAEKTAVRELASEARRKLKSVRGADGRPMPWDIEFGFVDGELTLFQVRPLVERGSDKAARVVEQLSPAGKRVVDKVSLDRVPGMTGDANNAP